MITDDVAWLACLAMMIVFSEGGHATADIGELALSSGHQKNHAELVPAYRGDLQKGFLRPSDGLQSAHY